MAAPTANLMKISSKIIKLFSCFILCLSFSVVVLSADEVDILINSVEKVADYYKRHAHEFNLDGIFGLHAVEGHVLKTVQTKELHKRTISDESFQKLKNLHTVLNKTLVSAVTKLLASDDEYVQSMKGVLKVKLDQFYPVRSLPPEDKAFAEKEGNHKVLEFNEEASDSCMQEVMGKDADTKCHFSQDCLLIMTLPGLQRYGATHQILFMLLAEVHGCTDKIDEFVKRHYSGLQGTRDVQGQIALVTYREMLKLIDSKDSQDQDLFLEQVYIGVQLGFEEFVTSAVIKRTVALQDPDSGCFREPAEDKREMAELDNPTSKDTESNKAAVKRQDRFPRRRLLVEADMSDGCLSHKTAVGAGALAVLLRWLLTHNTIYTEGGRSDRGAHSNGILLPKRAMKPIDNDFPHAREDGGDDDWENLGKGKLARDDDEERDELQQENREKGDSKLAGNRDNFDFELEANSPKPQEHILVVPQIPGSNPAPGWSHSLLYGGIFVVLTFAVYRYLRKFRVRHRSYPRRHL